MLRPRVVVTVVAAAALGGLLVWTLRSAPAVPAPAGTAVGPSASASPAAAAGQPVAFSTQSGATGGPDAEFVRLLRERFESRIGSKHAQIKLIEQVVAYLMASYPDDWQSRVRAVLNALFPELADALYARFEALSGYNAWLREQRSALTAMPAAERRQAVWAARRAAFGEDAEEIWAAERRGEQVQQTLDGLADSANLSAEEKLGVYLASIHEAWGEHAPQLIEARRTELLNRFLEIDSVQDQLRALSAAQRHETLRTLRGEMGMDASALDRWSALDASRDRSWSQGEQYMRERERILVAYAAEAQNEQLQKLREQLLGAEAEIVRAEEEAGFYRYGRPRQIGRE